MKLLAVVMTFLFIPAVSADSRADNYPSKAIRLVVPFPPAGTADILARTIGQKLTERWGQQVIIDNRPGAGGNIGANVVAKAPPDGYTLLMGTAGTHGINASVYSKMPYDTLKDFIPITLVASVPNLLTVNPSIPVKSVKELIALAKAKPGQLTFGSSGNGTAVHLAGELLKTQAGIDLVHVPYKGSAQATSDLLSGHISMIFSAAPGAMPYVKAGRLRVLAVTSVRRMPALPDIPTMIEAGVPDYEAESWFGMFAPAGTPNGVIAKLNAAIVEILQTPEMKQRLSDQGAEPVGNTSAQFAVYVKEEMAKWAKVVNASGARVD